MAFKGWQVIVLEWSMITITFLIVLLRIYHPHLRRSSTIPRYADIFVFIAWLSFFIQAVLDTVLWRLHFFEPQPLEDDITKSLKITWTENCLYLNALYAIKVAVLAQCEVLFVNISSRTIWAFRGVFVIVVVSWASEVFMNVLGCWPISSHWDIKTGGFCPGLEQIFITECICHIITDVLVYFLSLLFYSYLKYNIHLLFEMSIMFILSFGCIAIAIVNLIATMHGLNTTTPYVLCIVEQSYAIFVVCFPMLKALSGRRRRGPLQDMKTWEDGGGDDIVRETGRYERVLKGRTMSQGTEAGLV